MQLTRLSKTSFLGTTEEKRKMHMVRWSTVTLPKDLGGLGLHSMKDRNLAILAKLCWRLASEQGNLGLKCWLPST